MTFTITMPQIDSDYLPFIAFFIVASIINIKYFARYIKYFLTFWPSKSITFTIILSYIPVGYHLYTNYGILSTNINVRTIFVFEILYIFITTILIPFYSCVSGGNSYYFKRAAYHGDLEKIKCLISEGADVHEDNDAAIKYAARNGHLDVVKYLVKNGANIRAENDEALRLAAYFGRLEIVNYIRSITYSK